MIPVAPIMLVYIILQLIYGKKWLTEFKRAVEKNDKLPLFSIDEFVEKHRDALPQFSRIEAKAAVKETISKLKDKNAFSKFSQSKSSDRFFIYQRGFQLVSGLIKLLGTTVFAKTVIIKSISDTFHDAVCSDGYLTHKFHTSSRSLSEFHYSQNDGRHYFMYISLSVEAVASDGWIYSESQVTVSEEVKYLEFENLEELNLWIVKYSPEVEG